MCWCHLASQSILVLYHLLLVIFKRLGFNFKLKSKVHFVNGTIMCCSNLYAVHFGSIDEVHQSSSNEMNFLGGWRCEL